MSFSAAGIFFVMVAAGFTVTGIVGFGANVLMMPILSLIYPLQDLVLIFALISFVNAFFRVIESHRGIIWRPFLLMLVNSMSGTVLGLWVFRILPEMWLKWLLGCFVVIMAVFNLATHDQEVGRRVESKESLASRIFYRVMLFTGGFLHGSFVCGGPMYVIYCNHYYGMDRAHFRGMQFGLVFFNSTLIMAVNLWHGVYDVTLVLPSILGVCGLAAAFFLSSVLMKHLNDKVFYLLVQIVLLISGLNLMVQAGPRIF